MELRGRGQGIVRISETVEEALAKGKPVVGMETALLTHGLPKPANEEIFREMISKCVEAKAVHAPVSMIDGELRIGMDDDEIATLASAADAFKVGVGDIPFAVSRRISGGTTVSATLRACAISGIEVMATGGIGGVHRGDPSDVSSDMFEFTRSSVMCICSGPKSVLDVRATYETLETLGVPVAAYGTDYLPSFLSRSCGRKAAWRVESPIEAARSFRLHSKIMEGSMIVANPVDERDSIDHIEVENWLNAISVKARGKELTPALLTELNRISRGRSLGSNRALLLNNTSLAARIASELYVLRPLG